MMEWITVLALVFFGLSLVIIEIIFVPGTTLVGIMGFLFQVAGVYLGFEYFDKTTAWGILIGSVVLSVAAVVLTLRTRAWERFSLKRTLQDKVNEGLTTELGVGDTGITTSVLRPIGKAEIKDAEYEVSTIGNYLDTGQNIEIIKIEGNKIIVKPI